MLRACLLVFRGKQPGLVLQQITLLARCISENDTCGMSDVIGPLKAGRRATTRGAVWQAVEFEQRTSEVWAIGIWTAAKLTEESRD